MNRFVNKIAVVTGASGGIGEQIAKELLKQSVNVIGIARSTDKLRTISEEVASQSGVYKGKFTAFTCDTSKDEDIKETFAKIKESFGSITILINNAAVAHPVTDKLSKVEKKTLDQIFNTNTNGYLLCANEAIALMDDSPVGGHIINIISVIGLPTDPTRVVPVYAASKKAVRALMDNLRRELVGRKSDIKISNINPGLVDTSMPPDAGYSMPHEAEKKLGPEDVADSCIAVLSTAPNVVVLDYTVTAKFCDLYYNKM